VIGGQHEEIEKTAACVDCHSCHNAFFTGCESMMGTDDPHCHMQCNEDASCKQCTAAHENAWKQVAPEFDACVVSCDAGSCAVDGTLDHEQTVFEPHNMDDCMMCHRSCDDEDCHLTCDTVCGIQKNQEMMDAAHNPIIPEGRTLPPVGDERGPVEEERNDDAARRHVVDPPKGREEATERQHARVDSRETREEQREGPGEREEASNGRS